MRRPIEIEREQQAMTMLAGLTGVFEGIASMRISQIKNQVQQSTNFFHELWNIYAQLRVGSQFGFGRARGDEVIDKELYIIITAEGGFSGDIDLKLIRLMLETYNKDKNAIIVIGHHGVMQLAQRGISYEKYFKLPVNDRNINATPITNEVQKYKSTILFYQQYESLTSQKARKIELSRAVQDEGDLSKGGGEAISDTNYIFEPSTFAVVDHLERSMMKIAISQLILESKLAQYASRFRAMSESHRLADEAKHNLTSEFYKSKRAYKDERLKEIINSLKKSKVMAGIKP